MLRDCPLRRGGRSASGGGWGGELGGGELGEVVEVGDGRVRVEGEKDLKQEKENSISDIWEKWGRHIWGKGVLGIRKKKREKYEESVR